MKHMGKMLLSAALSALAFFGLGGCVGAALPDDPPVCGGTTDRTDHDAPKKIESKTLTDYHAHFYLRGEWSPGRADRFYTCEVKKDEQGVLTAVVHTDTTEKDVITLPADEALLTTLQAIIDAHNLAAQNGYYRVTAGLPPEFQTCRFEANYASGEKLTFTVNNNPDAEWTRETYLAFANWFAAKGDDSLLPPKLSYGPVKDCRFTFTEDGKKIHYGPVRVQEKDAIDGERLLLEKSIYETGAQDYDSDRYILFPEDYTERIREILSAHDLRAFDYHSVLYKKPTKEDKEKEWYRHTLQIHVNFEDGKGLRIDTSDAGRIEALRPLLADLFAYHDSLFED